MCRAKALCSRGMLRGVVGEREAQKPSRTRNTSAQGPRSIVVATPTGEANLRSRFCEGIRKLLLYRWCYNSGRCSILAPESCFIVVRSLHHRCCLLVSTRRDDPNALSTISSCSKQDSERYDRYIREIYIYNYMYIAAYVSTVPGQT